ncbi:MAG: aspartate/glutamate racemase family protein [Vagococcus sp.]
MKTIGLIGGMSWESTVTYYTQINQLISKELGGLHSAKLLLASVDFAEIESCQSANEWEKSGELLLAEALKLEMAGADFLMICTNTMHKVYDQINENCHIPIIHIADATIDKLEKNKLKKIGLLGTKYTMEQDFYKKRLTDAQIEVLIPQEADRKAVNDIIFNELVLGDIKQTSKETYLHIIEKMIGEGVEGVILGCTEIGLLIKQSDVAVPVFDTTLIHSQKAVEMALE